MEENILTVDAIHVEVNEMLNITNVDGAPLCMFVIVVDEIDKRLNVTLAI